MQYQPFCSVIAVGYYAFGINHFRLLTFVDTFPADFSDPTSSEAPLDHLVRNPAYHTSLTRPSAASRSLSNGKFRDPPHSGALSVRLIIQENLMFFRTIIVFLVIERSLTLKI